MARFICILLVLFVSCKAAPQLSDPQEMLYIEVEGKKIKIIEDEYGNQFMKQSVADGRFIYIPFKDVAETEDPSDSLHSYQVKTK
jgi:hypothetical protein